MSWLSHFSHVMKFLPAAALLVFLTSGAGGAAQAAGSQQSQGSFNAAGAQELSGAGSTQAEGTRMGFVGAVGDKQAGSGQTDLLPASTVAVPEPGVVLLQLSALATLGLFACRRRRG